MLGVTALTYLTTHLLLERARFGYKLLAIREHEEAAEMIGVDTVIIKMKAFALSAFFPGVLGGIYAYWVTYIHPDSVLKADVTDFMVVMAFLGGIGSLWGPFLGAVVVQLVQRILWLVWGEGTFYLVIIGAAIRAVVLFIPNGLVGLKEVRFFSPREGLSQLRKRLNGRKMILESQELKKSFGGVMAINHLSLSVEKGTVFGIIGPNGSGKTTFFNLVTGVYTPDGGSVVFNGKNITGLRPHQIAELGIGRTFQYPCPIHKNDRSGKCDGQVRLSAPPH